MYTWAIILGKCRNNALSYDHIYFYQQCLVNMHFPKLWSNLKTNKMKARFKVCLNLVLSDRYICV